ncbi:MAG: ArnT family glycosyltransferase [Bacteroidia bacterium]
MFNRSLINQYAHSLIIVLCIIAVVVFKIPHLSLPFFWDEAWVYVPAVKTMAEGIPSLMPDAIPVSYTRGHPLLFHFLASSWIKIFGQSNVALHSFALCISVALLVSVYYFGKTIFNKNVAVTATVLLSVQAVFMAQSSFVLPEVMLALFVVLTILFFLKEANIIYVAAATGLLLTKESGIVLIAVLGLWLFIESFFIAQKRVSFFVFLKKSLILLLPVFIASVYFIIQWKKYGWFFYPEHIGIIDVSYSNFSSGFKNVYMFLFEEQGRRRLTMAFVIMFLLFFNPLQFKWRIILAFLMFACVKIFFGAWLLPPLLTLIVCGLIVLSLFYFIPVRSYSQSLSLSDKAIGVIYLFMISFLLFSSVNFLSKRYLLCLIPLYTLGFSYFLHIYFSQTKWAFVTVSILAVLYCSLKLFDTKLPGDDNMSYVKVITLQKEVISYMEAQNLYDRNIHATFLNSYEMTSPFSSFLSGEKRFSKVGEGLTDSTQYAIITNYQMDELYDVIPNSDEFEEIKRFENANFWAGIYQRK